MQVFIGFAILVLIGFTIWSATSHRGIKHVLMWSGIGLLAAILVTTVMLLQMPPPPGLQEQLGVPSTQQETPSSFVVSFFQYSGHLVIWLVFSAVGVVRQYQKSTT